MKNEIKKIPVHLGIIIDGNRRWAKKKGLPSFVGHKKGLDNVNKIGERARELGVKILTLYIFSTENWERPKKEVNYLIRLIAEAFNKKILKNFNKKK